MGFGKNPTRSQKLLIDFILSLNGALNFSSPSGSARFPPGLSGIIRIRLCPPKLAQVRVRPGLSASSFPWGSTLIFLNTYTVSNSNFFTARNASVWYKTTLITGGVGWALMDRGGPTFLKEGDVFIKSAWHKLKQLSTISNKMELREKLKFLM